MKKSAKKALAVLFSVLGTVLGLYIGGYWLFVRPVYWLVTGFTGGTLTAGNLIINVIILHPPLEEVFGVYVILLQGILGTILEMIDFWGLLQH